MIGNLGLPDYVGEAAGKVKTLTVAVFNSTTTIVSSHWNRVDGEKFLQVSKDFAVSINTARLKCRKFMGPKHRDFLFQEVFIRLKSCTLIQNCDFPKCPKSPIRSEILIKDDLRIEGIFSKIVWILLQNSKPDIDFHILDDRMRAWNTRFDEENLFRKIGSPSSWEINEIDDTAGEMYHRMVSDGVVRSVSSNKIRNNLSKFADDTLGTIASGVGDGEPANEMSHNQSRESCDVTTNDTHGALYSGGKLFKQEKGRPSPATSKADSQSRNSRCSRGGYEKGLASNDGLIGHMTGIQEQAPDLNRKYSYYKNSQERKRLNLHPTPEKNTENDGLTIHIPSNVQKIVLIKDGRKVTVEL